MEKKILFFDCFSGISGDMTIGALLDLGVDKDYFLDCISKLNIKGFEIKIKKSSKKGIGGTDFNVKIDSEIKQPQRNLNDILEIINQSGLNENIKSLSEKIFRIITEAEAAVHNKPVEEIHFHEIGAVDSIVDIVGTAVCIDSINADEILSSPLNLGSGFVVCNHGTIPVPAPATLEILKDVPVYSWNIKKEMTTPTGAGIIKALSTGFTDFPSISIERTGYGLGKRDLEIPNVLRVVLGKTREIKAITLLETNIDNMNPEIYGYIFPKLFEKGALDVYITPIIMKKNRPACILSVLCPEDKSASIEDFIFRETPTLGIRKYKVEREEMDRKTVIVETKFGKISVKAAYLNNKIVKFAPEYEECSKIAESSGIPIFEVYQEIISSARNLIKDLV